MAILRESRKLVLFAFGVVGMSLFICPSASPQVAGATLSGTVTDATGAVIINAKITLSNAATAVERTAETDSAGVYSMPNIPAGIYQISASASGFSTELQNGIVLDVGATRLINISLHVGNVSQTVQVTGENASVQLANATIIGEVSAIAVRDLPLNGRDWTQLATLQVGVTALHAQASGTPFSLLIAGDPLGQKNSTPSDFPDRLRDTPGCSNPISAGNPLNYLKLNCFTPPTAPTSFASVCKPAAASVAAVIPNTCMNLFGNNGRNTLIGPGLVDFDFSVFKNNYIPRISETFNIQFRFEAFNIFNRANFQAPIDNSTIFTQTGTPVAGAGAIDVTTTTSRQIQLGLNLFGDAASAVLSRPSGHSIADRFAASSSRGKQC